MLALIEQSHALIPDDLLSGRFGTGAGRQLTRGELRLWNPDRRQLPACHANQSRWCSMVCAETTTSAQCSGWPMRSCWNGLSSVACTSTYENASWCRRHAALSTGVPWAEADTATSAVVAAKANGASVLVVEQTSISLPPEQIRPAFPVCLVLGSEDRGVSQEILNLADDAVAIPLLGMGNSLNVTSAAAIVLYWLSRCRRPGSDRLSSGQGRRRP